jgi:hypothetical protein
MRLLVGAILVCALIGNCDLNEHDFSEALLTHVHQFCSVSFIASLSTKLSQDVWSDTGFLCSETVTLWGMRKETL